MCYVFNWLLSTCFGGRGIIKDGVEVGCYRIEKRNFDDIFVEIWGL